MRFMYVSVSNANDMEFCLSIALGNEMDMASLTLLISKQRLFHAEKALLVSKSW